MQGRISGKKIKQLIGIHHRGRIGRFDPGPVIPSDQHVVNVLIVEQISLHEATPLQKLRILRTESFDRSQLTIHSIKELFMSFEPFSICYRLPVPLQLCNHDCRRCFIFNNKVPSKTPIFLVSHFTLMSLGNIPAAKWGLPVIIQEFIHGTEVNVTALGDGKGNMIGAVPMRKQYITDKGKAWAGISIDDKKLLSITQKVIRTTKWRGGLELEMIRTGEGEYYLLEINPRFPAWVYLAVGCGQNHPEALIKMALGLKVKPFSKYDIGKMFIRYSWDMIVELKEFEKISTKGEL